MSAEARHPSIAGKRVLVVNDTQEILELFTDILRDLDLEVIQMSYAPRELELVRQADPDLIILDMIFGNRELLGWQLLQKIRMDRGLERVPVVVCSAAIQTLIELEGYLTEQGVVTLIKPFTVSQLEEAVLHALRAEGFGGAPSATEVAREGGDQRGSAGSASA